MIPFPPFIPVHLFFKAWLFVLTSTSHRSVSCDAAVLHAWSQLYASFKKSVQTSPCLLSHLLTPGVPQSSGELKKQLCFQFSRILREMCVVQSVISRITGVHHVSSSVSRTVLTAAVDKKAFPIVVGSVLYFTSLSPCRYLHEKLLIYSAATSV